MDPATFTLAKLALVIAKQLRKVQDERRDEVMAELNRANAKLDDLLATALREAMFFFDAGEFDKARERAVTAISQDRYSAVSHLVLAMSSMADPSHEAEAMRHLAEALSLNPFLAPMELWGARGVPTIGALGEPSKQSGGRTRALESDDPRLRRLMVRVAYDPIGGRADDVKTQPGSRLPGDVEWVGFARGVIREGFQAELAALEDALASRPFRRIMRIGVAVDLVDPDVQYVAAWFGSNQLGVFDALNGRLLWTRTLRPGDSLIGVTPKVVMFMTDSLKKKPRVRLLASDSGVELRTYELPTFQERFFPSLVLDKSFLSRELRPWNVPQRGGESFWASHQDLPSLSDDEIRHQLETYEAPVPKHTSLRQVGRTVHVVDPYGRGFASVVASDQCVVHPLSNGRFMYGESWGTVIRAPVRQRRSLGPA